MKTPIRRYALHWRETGLMARRRLLETLLGAPVRIHGPGRRAAPDVAWIGWGLKKSGLRARRLAERDRCGLALLEDGFLRSLGLGVSGAPPLSIVVDGTGVHYDATRPSDLENALRADSFAAAELEAARHAMALIRRDGISKYNIGLPPPENAFPQGEEHVLVVDQTAGDLSLRHGLVEPRTFRDMLEAALDENPHATIWIRTHPDVLSGRRQGMVPDVAEPRIRIMPPYWHPADVLKHFHRVYVATSLLGMEALIAGVPVRCFGLPFYAGWGLTEDVRTSPRRGIRRTLEELFAAAYLRHARYLDPRTGRRGDIFAVLQHLAALRRERAFWAGAGEKEWSGRVFVFGFRLWKHAQTAPFFGEETEVRFVRSLRQARRAGLNAGDRLAVWGMRDPPDLTEVAEGLDLKVVRVEDGFLRSVGLGTDFVPPWSLVFDDLGIYFDARTASRLERLLAETEFTPELLEAAKRLRRYIVELDLTKYNLDAAGEKADFRVAAGSRPVILVPGQVEMDAAIRYGGRTVRTNAELLHRVRAARPDAFIIWKPHPDVLAGNRATGGEVDKLADHVETMHGISACIRACDEVHTMTSLSGFDALLRGKRVVTYGMPFYAGWGLTEDMDPNPWRRRHRRLTLDMLVAGALLLYPRYRDPRTGTVLDAQETAERLARLRDEALPSHGSPRKWWLLLRGTAESVMWHARRTVGHRRHMPGS